MSEIKLMRICFGGVELQVPEIWNVETEMYTEPDGRECAMIDVSAVEGDAEVKVRLLNKKNKSVVDEKVLKFNRESDPFA